MEDAQPPATVLPDGLEAYRQTDSFTEASLPAALRKAHCTKQSVWGLIHVTEGELVYRVLDPRRSPSELALRPDGAPGVVEPTILHEVEPRGAVRFHVAFFR